MKMLSKFLLGVMSLSLLLPNLNVAAAEVALTVKVLNAPTVMYEDFTFEVATANGSDISSALQGKVLGFSFQKKDGSEGAKVFKMSFEENEFFSVEDLGSKYRVTVDVTAEGDLGFEVDSNNGIPSVNHVSLSFSDTDYVLEFGEYVSTTPLFGGTTTYHIASMVETEFSFVTEPARMEVFPGAEVNAGDEMYVVVYDEDDNVTALPGDYYISLFDTTALTSMGTSIDGFVTESALEGLYYFNAPAKAASYRINMGPLALVARTDSFDFQVVASAVAPFNPQVVIDASDFNYEGVNLGDATIPRDIADLLGDDDAEVVVIGEIEIPDFIFDPEGEPADPVICDDLKESFWAYEIINSLLDSDLYPVQLNGGDVECRAEEAVLRKEFTVWLLEAYYPEDVADIQGFHDDYDYDDSPFSDVDGDSAYDPYIVMAAEKGIVSGNPDGTFKPNKVINRAEVLKILLRSSELFEATAGQMAALDEDFDPVGRFVDEDNDDWYTPYLHFAVEAEIIEGRTEMRNGRMVRVAAMADGVLYGEAAKILYLARQ